MELQKEILGLAIAYALLAALLLVIALRARIPWPLKVAMVLVTSAYYCVAFFRIEYLPGWSATAPLPPQFQLLWARIVEPNPLDRDPGAVHVWIEDLDSANLPSGQPRAYRLPYSATLAAKVQAARDEIMKGRPQGGRAADIGAGNGQPAPEGPSDVSTFRPAAAPGGDPAGGGPLDLSFLTGESGSIDSRRCRLRFYLPRIRHERCSKRVRGRPVSSARGFRSRRFSDKQRARDLSKCRTASVPTNSDAKRDTRSVRRPPAGRNRIRNRCGLGTRCRDRSDSLCPI
jgi:hypothetical protein